jgi:bifunctional pyridoxal-dependent enzyme with beta-cystathionase and maltose regulon repressor activities
VISGCNKFFGPGSNGYIRLAVATSKHILSDALDRLKEGLANWQKAEIAT